MTFAEKRTAQRFQVQVPTDYEDSHAGSGLTENLSLSGALIEPASTSIEIQTEVQLRFAFFIGSSNTVFRGTVVRHTSDGFAVHFGYMDEAQLRVLRRIHKLAPLASP